jgi:hypothetical protein
VRKLIAIMTCHHKTASAQAQRQTWARDIVGKGYADVKFFLGQPNEQSRLLPDEVWLDVPDDYRGIPLKVKAICDYAREHCYDEVSKCDDDVYVVPERYKMLPIVPADYVGRFRTPYGNVYPPSFASGFFYTLSSRAAGIVADTPWNGDWMDERFVATALARRGIIGYHDAVNYVVSGPHLVGLDVLANDSLRKGTVFCEYGPAAIHAMHLAMRHLNPVKYEHIELTQQPQVVVTDEILASKPNDDVPEHKRVKNYVSRY